MATGSVAGTGPPVSSIAMRWAGGTGISGPYTPCRGETNSGCAGAGRGVGGGPGAGAAAGAGTGWTGVSAGWGGSAGGPWSAVGAGAVGAGVSGCVGTEFGASAAMIAAAASKRQISDVRFMVVTVLFVVQGARRPGTQGYHQKWDKTHAPGRLESTGGLGRPPAGKLSRCCRMGDASRLRPAAAGSKNAQGPGPARPMNRIRPTDS